jgi:hypothetical protein
MPKPPPEQRFRISCEVSVADLGPAMVDLARIKGLSVTGNELITDVPTYVKKTYETSTEDFLKAWIADHPTFRANEAAKHFEANGRTGGLVYPALNSLVGKKLLRKLGPGQYSRADIKHLAPPKRTRIDKGPRATFDKRGEDVILSYAKRNHGRVNTAKMVEIFANEGRARNSVYASIDALIKDKALKRVGDKGSGQYVLLTKSAKPKTPEQPIMNGAAPVAEVQHG